MAKETNIPTVSEPVESQEPVSEGLEETAEVAVEGTGTVEEEPSEVSETGKGKEQAKGVDLNKAIAKLTPAEQKAYKAFQADYTKKSQAAAKITEYEQYLNNLVADPEISAILKARQTKAEKEKQPDFSKMSDEEIFNYTVDKRVQDKLSELETKMDSKYGTYIQNKLVAEGNKLIQDFAEAKKITTEEVKDLAKYAIEHRVTLEEAYVIANSAKVTENAEQKALEDLDLKKKANLELGSTPTGITPVMPGKPTVRQAYELAKKQIGIK